MSEHEWKPGDRGLTVGGGEFFVVGKGVMGKTVFQVRKPFSNAWHVIDDVDKADDGLRPMTQRKTVRQVMYLSQTGRLFHDQGHTTDKTCVMLDITTEGNRVVDVQMADEEASE